MVPIEPDEITPEALYLSRRRFLRAAAAAGAAPLVASACDRLGVAPDAAPKPKGTESGSGMPSGALPGSAPSATGLTDELGDPLTDYEAVTTYNNYYEFSTDKEAPSRLARGFQTSPWSVAIGGLVGAPTTLSVEEIVRRFPSEERVYRLRCVEGWSMVIPWLGFPLARVLDLAKPLPDARFVRFETALVPEQMPGLDEVRLDWPYVEGLRLDEAMHDLTILATGLYGKALPPQNGAPVRLVVPWKYGFKSIKSIVRIDLVEEMPVSTWMVAAPDEYGFFANVNPEVDHPRWSQATERRIGELRRRRTLPFNGYADEVAELYAGMDLRENF